MNLANQSNSTSWRLMGMQGWFNINSQSLSNIVIKKQSTVIHCINNFFKKILSVVTGKFTMPYVKYIANGNVLYDPGNPNRGSVRL